MNTQLLIDTSRAMVADDKGLLAIDALCQEAGLVPVVEPEVLMDGGSPAKRFHPVELPARDAGRNHPETEHGASRTDLSAASIGGRSGRRHGELSSPNRSRCRARDCVFVGRPVR